MSCVLCGADTTTPLFEKGGYTICRCPQCSLTQLDPKPTEEEITAFYSAEYFEGSGDQGYDAYGEQADEYGATFAEEIRILKPRMLGPRVLDAGCGFGFFMNEAAKEGLEACGVDLSEAAVERVREHHPDRVMEGTLDTVRNSDWPKFHAVFASHTIEHLLDPLAFVREAHDLLEDDGMLVLVTPNVESMLSRVSGKRWVSYKVPEHITYFSPGTIQNLVEQCGFETVDIQPAYQFYKISFIASKLRDLTAPVSKIVPPLERVPAIGNPIIRITSGSLRILARKRTAK